MTKSQLLRASLTLAVAAALLPTVRAAHLAVSRPAKRGAQPHTGSPAHQPTPAADPKLARRRPSAGPTLALQVGHSASVDCFAFSPDGKILATGAGDGTAILWELSTGAIRARLEGHDEAVQHVYFPEDGQTVVTIAEEAARIWDARTGRLRAVLRDSRSDTGWSAGGPPGGRLLVSMSDPLRAARFGAGAAEGRAAIWDVTTAAQVAVLTGTRVPFAFSPDGRIVAAASRTGDPCLWRLGHGDPAVPLPAEGATVMDLALSPDGRRVAAVLARGSAGWEVRLWDTESGRIQAVIQGTPGATGIGELRFSGNGRALMLDGYALWATGGPTPRPLLKTGDGEIMGLAGSPDGRVLAVACRGSGKPDPRSRELRKEVRLYDTVRERFTRTLRDLTAADTQFVFSRDGRILAGASQTEAAIRLWDTRTGALLRSLRWSGSPLDRLVLAPDGAYLGAMLNFAELTVWDVRSGVPLRALKEYDGKPRENAHSAVAHSSPDGRTLAVTRLVNGFITQCWDLASGRLLATLDGEIAFSHDGSLIARYRRFEPVDGPPVVDLSTWSARNWYRQTSLGKPEGRVLSLAFSPDDATIATAGAEAVQLWDARTGALKATLQGGRGAVAFSPDGRTLASGGEGATIALWDAASSRRRLTLRKEAPQPVGAQEAAPSRLLFSPDGKTLAVYRHALSGAHLELWDTERGNIKHVVRSGGAVFGFSADSRRLAIGETSETAGIEVMISRTLPLRLWDVEKGAPIPLTPGTRLDSFPPELFASAAGETTVLRDPRDGRLVATLFPLFAPQARPAGPLSPDAIGGDWLVTTPAGYCDGSPRARSLIRWNVDGVLYPAERYRARFHRPDLVRKALEGALGPITAQDRRKR